MYTAIMVRVLVVVAALLALLSIPTQAIQADDNTPPGSVLADPPQVPPGLDRKQKAEQYFVAFVGKLETYQAKQKEQRGRYWQALPSHSNAPALDAYPDRWFDKPSDAGPAWANANVLEFAQTPIRVVVDEYVSPWGAGYVVRAQYTENGVLYERCAEVGPEQRCQSTLDWYQVVQVAP